MNLFESVRTGVTARQVAEHYGIKVKRNGMAVCPFHDDRNPSLKLDKRYHCFGCGADGDAIDLAGRLFGLAPTDAAKKLADDFSIPYDRYEKNGQKKEKQKAGPHREPTVEKRTIKLEKQMKNWMAHAYEVLIRYKCWLDFWRKIYRPEPEDEEWNPLFVESLKKQELINYYLDILLLGDDYARLDFSQA